MVTCGGYHMVTMWLPCIYAVLQFTNNIIYLPLSAVYNLVSGLSKDHRNDGGKDYTDARTKIYVYNFKTNKYLQKNISKNTILEALLTLYFLFGMYSAFVVGPEGDFGLFPFHMLLFFGFGFVVYSSIKAKV